MTKRDKIFYGSVFILLKKDDKYLLQQRMNTGFMDGSYDAGASGHVEPDESMMAAAIRETKEEIGVDVAEEDMKLVRMVQSNIDIPYISCVYICEKWSGDIVNGELDKISDLIWCTKDEMPESLTRIMSLMKGTNFSEELSFEYIDEARLKELMPGVEIVKAYL